MSPLTPLDVETLQFRAGLRGYDKQEVETFRANVMQTLVEYIDQIGRLRMRIGEMESEVARYRETEDLVKSSVMLAQRSSEDIIGAAKDRAQALVEQARAEGDKVRQGIARIQNEREQFEYEFHALLTGYLSRLLAHNPRLDPEAQGSPLTGSVRRQADPLEAALTQAQAESQPPQAAVAPAQPVAAPVQPAPAPLEAAPAVKSWSIITSAAPAAEAAETVAGEASSGARAASDSPASTADTTPRPAVPIPDQHGSTFHAYSEPEWSSQPAQAAEGENKRDADIDDFTRALEGRP